MLKIFKPTTPARRKTSVSDTKSLSKNKYKKLLKTKKKKSGRNNKGRITVRHQGGGAKRFLRKIDFKRDKFEIPGKVKTLEYDPNRSAWIALIVYNDGEKRYILAPDKLEVGETVLSSKEKIELKTGNRMPLKYLPVGTQVHDIELVFGQGGKLARSAGNTAVLMGTSNGFVQIKLPSTERRLIKANCLATIGQVSNPDWRYIRWGKAGRMRHRGIRPTVRGKAMAPVAHPHGGGEGNSPIGLKHPKTPWGKPALGVKTRKKKKWTNKHIIKRRAKKRRKK